MYRLMWSSKSSMKAQQKKLDSISNNMANVNTDGYKRSEVTFEDLVYDTLERKGYAVSKDRKGKAEVQNGTGVKATAWTRDNKQGSLTETGIKTNLAIDGKGFFEVKLPDGSSAYKRSGSFNVDLNGNISDKNGNRLSIVDEKGNEINTYDGDIKFTSDNFIVSKGGDVSILKNDKYEKVGNIKIKDFVGNNALRPIGESLFVPIEGAESVDTNDYDIHQGYLELSNVDVAKEMTDMILTQRAFQLSSSSLKTADEMWGMINNLSSR